MKHLTSWLRNYFGFSQLEIRGFIALSLILVSILGYTFFSKFFQPNDTYTAQVAQTDQQELQKWVAQINEQQKLYAEQHPKPSYQQNYAKNTTDKTNIPTNSATYTLVAFNPNTATVEELQKLGIAPFIAQRIQKYREKGGKFRLKTDFKKMYGLSEEKYNELATYIQLPDNLSTAKDFTKEQTPYTSTSNPIAPTTTYIPKKPVQFDLNAADTAQLKTIKGIGSVLADRIIKFRTKLGGFHAKEQLTEVYGLQPDVIEELVKYGVITTRLTKININTADEATLKAHPYIGYKVASVLIAYRKQHGNYKTADDLLKIHVLDASKVEKLKPYLEF